MPIQALKLPQLQAIVLFTVSQKSVSPSIDWKYAF